MSEDRAQELKKTAAADSGAPQPPAANQSKDEPFAAAPDGSPQASDPEADGKARGASRPSGSAGRDAEARDAAAAGSSALAPGEQGSPPRPMQVDDVGAAATMAQAATMPASATGGVPTPGDAQGVAVPSVQAAAASSEQSNQVEGVRVTALAPPGKPDGEVDTRA